MKSIPSAMQGVLATPYGTEPVCIIEIQWLDSGQWHLYASKDITEYNVSGIILSISDLESVIKLDSQGQTQQINVTLSDTAGTLKNIIDNYNIHGRPCRVYQWFEKLPLDEKFLLFEGEIVSDIQWSEGDRTLAFQAITKIQDREVGFSPEEGTFYAVPEDLVGVPWPLVFGFVQHVPAAQIQNFPSTNIREELGVTDPTLAQRLSNTLTELETVTSQRDFTLVRVNEYKRVVENFEALGKDPGEWGNLLQDAESSLSASQAKVTWLEQFQANLETRIAIEEEYERVQIAIGDSSLYPQNTPIELSINGVLYTGVFDGDNFVIGGVELDYGSDLISDFGFTFHEGGSVVKLGSDTGSVYVANIISSTVNYIKANKTIGDITTLTKVPENYYTVETLTMGIYTVTLIKFATPLTEYEGAGWDDKIYVTLESVIGPNTVDIMEWLIDTYTDLTYDSTTFTYVKGKLENYPSNFALLDRSNIMTLLEDIAFQARCAIWLIKGVFYLKYLPEEVAEVDTITESDIDVGTIEISTSSSEEIVTKLVAEWKLNYHQEKNHKLILRHNIDLYGVKERVIDFFIYNISSLVAKSANFWLIRFANVWKNIEFTTCPHKLALETFDTVKFDFNTAFVANADIKGLITGVNYNMEGASLKIKAWLPILFGTMEQYNFAWPANIDATLVFVTDIGDTPGQLVNDNDLERPEWPRTIYNTKPSDSNDIKPREIFEYEAGEPPEPETRGTEIEQTDIYIGQVKEKTADKIYSVDVYERGQHFEADQHGVRQLDQVEETTVPIGAWVFVIKHTKTIKTQTLLGELQAEMSKALAKAKEWGDKYTQAKNTETVLLREYERASLEYQTAPSERKNTAKELLDKTKIAYINAQTETLQTKEIWQTYEDYADKVQAALTTATNQSLVELWGVATTPSVTVSGDGGRVTSNDDVEGTNPNTTVIEYTMQVLGTSVAVYPGKVVSGSGSTYQVEIYENGLDGNITDGSGDTSKYEKSVKQLQIAPDENIRPGTWTLVLKQTTSDPEGPRVEYTMQAVNAAETFAGKITGGGTNKLYNVDVYINGRENNPIGVEVYQLQLSAGVLIPVNTWVLVTRKLIGVDEEFNPKYEYSMQVPIWL